MEASETRNKIIEIEGDIFDAPDGAALIHACNCQGSWGKGIAEVFRAKYPAAFQLYRSHCQKYLDNPESRDVSTARSASENNVPSRSARRIQLPEGTALIIPPQKRDYEKTKKRHWIICLFTSKKFGRSVSGPAIILANTELAVEDMVEQLNKIQSKELGPEEIPLNTLWSCRFNSGLFRVDWKLTRKVLERADLEITVVRPPGE